MKNIAALVRNLPGDKYQELATAVNDVLDNKRFNRKQRRQLARNWRKYGERKGFEYRCLRLECEGVFRRHMLSYRLYNQVP